MMSGERDPTEGLPEDLARALRDPSIVIPQDAAVWELLAKWRNAPSNTASASSGEGRRAGNETPASPPPPSPDTSPAHPVEPEPGRVSRCPACEGIDQPGTMHAAGCPEAAQVAQAVESEKSSTSFPSGERPGWWSLAPPRRLEIETAAHEAAAEFGYKEFPPQVYGAYVEGYRQASVAAEEALRLQRVSNADLRAALLRVDDQLVEAMTNRRDLTHSEMGVLLEVVRAALKSS